MGHNSKIEVAIDEVLGFLNELNGLKRSVDERNGALRQRIKQILEQEDWNAKAFKTIRDIAVMSDTERADFLRTFQPIFEAMMEAVWAPEMKDLLSGAADGGEDDDDEAPDEGGEDHDEDEAA